MQVEIYKKSGGLPAIEYMEYDISCEIIPDLIIEFRKNPEKTLLECILSYITDISVFYACSIWQITGDTKLLISKQQKKRDSFPYDTYSKSYFKNMTVLSQNIALDPRFRGLKKIAKSVSLPSKPKAKRSIKSRSMAIIPISDTHQLVLCTKYATLEDIKNIIDVVHILKITASSEKMDGFMNANEHIVKVKEKENVKDIFLATVSHELRTPLNGIVGMITMMKDAGSLNEKQNEYLTILMECSHQLMNMMNDLLDFSKIASHRLALIKSTLDISSTVNNVINMMSGRIKAKGLEFITNLQQNIPMLMGDSQRITQILSNIISNAIKFTERGFIKLDMTAKLDSDASLPYVKRWRIDFSVIDTGVGINKDEHEKIFEMFHQSLDHNTTLSRNGIGLGLSICKELIKLMNGEIKVVSSGIEGMGSQFMFHIYAEEEIKLENVVDKHKEMLKNAKIMVVDDRAEYRLQLTDLLLNWGCSPTVVASGEEVLQYISHDKFFDIIIVDICMPYMSGIELAQELKANIKTVNVPLIALSSVELTTGSELFDVYMNKPIDQNLLFPAVLDCLIKKKGSKRISRSITPLGKREKKLRKDIRILIAEDDENNTYTIKEMLSHLNFDRKNIKTVDNGEKCIQEVKDGNYDVVLMDIKMPVMDGIEATKYIRQLPKRPYIIAVSAAVQNSDKQRCQQVGIDGYISKPVLKEKLNAALSALVSDY